MTRSQPFPISPQDLIGILKDYSPEQVPDGGWQDGRNVRFINGRVKAMPGYQKLNAAAVQAGASKRIMHGDEFLLSNGAIDLAILTLTKLYYWDPVGLTYTDKTGSFSFTGTINDFFMTDVGFNLMLICNGVDAAKKWAGSGGNIATLGGLSTAAPSGGAVIPHVLRPFQGFLVAINNQEDGAANPTRIRWSKIGQAEIWVNDVNGVGQAGYNDINDSPAPAYNGFQIGNSLAIYKEDSIYLMTYVGLPAVFNFRRVIFGRGLLAPRAVVPMGSVHMFLSDDDFYIFDGAQITPVGGWIRDYFFNDLNPLYANRVQAVLFKQFGEVWWIYPSVSSTGDFDKVLIYSYRKKTWTFAQFSASALFLYTLQQDYSWNTIPDLAWTLQTFRWSDIQLTADSALMMLGDTNGFVYNHTFVYDQDGAAYTKQAISKLYDFKMPGVHKRLQRVQFSADQFALTNLQVYVGTAENPSDTITWNGPYTLQTGHGQPYISVDLTGVYFAFRFESVGKNDPWEVMSFTPWFIPRTRQ